MSPKAAGVLRSKVQRDSDNVDLLNLNFGRPTMAYFVRPCHASHILFFTETPSTIRIVNGFSRKHHMLQHQKDTAARREVVVVAGGG